MNDDRDLEKKYGGNQSNNDYDDEIIDNEAEPEVFNKHRPPQHNPHDILQAYERKIKILIILLILSCFLFFAIGFSASAIFLKKDKNLPLPNVEEPNVFGEKFYQDLPELVAFLKKYYYKDLNEQQIKSLIVETITNQADRYTRLEPAGYYLGEGSNSKGGFGVRIEPVVSKDYAGIRVFSITKFTKAYENLLSGTNALYPSDIIVGYIRNGQIYEYFQNFLPRDLYPIVRYDARVVKGDNDYHQGIKFNDNYDPVKVIVYNPLSGSKKTREVVMQFKKYYNEKPFSIFTKKDFTGNAIDENYKLAYLRFNEFNQSELKRIMTDLNNLETLAPDLNELIFDLRNNPGGGAIELLKLINYFLKRDSKTPLYIMHQKETQLFAESDNGKVVLASSPQTYDIYTNKDGNDNPPSYKLSILVNENSASAAEVFSVVMKEHYPDCVIIGNNTFGKDLYQSIFSYESHKLASFKNYNIRVTNGKWGYFPKGSNKFYYITDPNRQIVGGSNGVLLNYFPAFTELPKNFTKIDTVSSDNIILSKAITKYLINNKDNTSHQIQSLFLELSHNIADFSKTNFLANPSKFLRVDGYFDSNLETALKAVLKSLGETSPDGVFNYNSFKLFFSYEIIQQDFSKLVENSVNVWHEVLDPSKQNDPFLHEAIYN